ncbi:hypothetical protein DPMN_012788 [Dreissena polymorpha]|uniref:C3H1-type domain-containing protein n=1 Tax=Dreissena polymorpha TaxID=45954 RepID=A0A9D4S355_DREPO|nr:hypothetical protein DPMN_012788 [Dreissena polymorpha]
MIMETEIQSVNKPEISDSEIPDEMAPQETAKDMDGSEDGEFQKENHDPEMLFDSKKSGRFEDSKQNLDSRFDDEEDGEAADAEDGEILEDGEIASDNDGEINDQDEGEEGGDMSPSKEATGASQEERPRRRHGKSDRHSKRQKKSDKESHKEGKSKKKRHREPSYEKSADDYDSGWTSDSKREKVDRKRERPSTDENHRRGSGESKHRDNRDSDREKGRDRGHGRHEREKSRGDRHEKKDRDKHSREKERDKNRNYDGYDSPPGLYDSPSDDDFNVSEEFMDMQIPKKKNKQQRKRELFKRQRHRERDEDIVEEQPVKKKPLLQTPMEERPICKFFKEGKCQKGPDCPFNHDYQPQKRPELCKYYVQSNCHRDGCVFMHEDFPCKWTLALQNVLRKEKENFFEGDKDWQEPRKHKKKGLLGDQPQMSEEEIHHKLEKMKNIPSIFDIQTHAPGESPNRPPKGMGPPNSMGGGPGMMSPGQIRPNMPFNGPPNRPPMFMGGGMDGPPMGMMPPMSGPPPMMPGSGMQGQAPGLQGPPMGPPMSQAAAIVGAILRAAPMLQQYRGVNGQGLNMNSMAGGMGQNMMGGMNMDGQNTPMGAGMDGPMNVAQGVVGMNNGQEAIPGNTVEDDQDMRHGFNGNAQYNQDSVDMENSDQDYRDLSAQDKDDRKQTLNNDPRLKRAINDNVPSNDEKVDSNQGNTTPQQEWDNNDDNLDIPAHLPPKQREMFLRIAQHTRKMKLEKSQELKPAGGVDEASRGREDAEGNGMKIDDDKWYSSDEEDDLRIGTKQSNNSSTKQAEAAPQTVVSQGPSFNVMQMINMIKSNPAPPAQPPPPPNRLQDPRMLPRPPREPAVINSQEGECPWRLRKVAVIKNRVPNIDLQDAQYKTDPRVQKIIKMQEQESGKVIDHTKTIVSQKTEPLVNPLGPKKPDLLDPSVFKAKEAVIPKPSLTPFVDPRLLQQDSSEPAAPRQVDPRMKQMDPRTLKVQTATLTSRASDPRLSMQDSNSATSLGGIGVLPVTSKALDPRLLRQHSQDPQTSLGGSTPPLDSRLMSRQTSSDPRLGKGNAFDVNVSLNLPQPSDPRFSKAVDDEISQMSLSSQQSQSTITSDRNSASETQAEKRKLDYRNDPRFKRKHISESNLSPDTVSKRLGDPRKVSTEYSSPLGGENSSKSEDSGYNSYNRPRPVKPTLATSVTSNLVSKSNNVKSSPSDLSTHDHLDSLQIMPPPTMADQAQGTDTNLKDIFKTIDPTASPFC